MDITITSTVKFLDAVLAHLELLADLIEEDNDSFISEELTELEDTLNNWTDSFPKGSQNFPELQMPHVVGAIQGFIQMADWNCDCLIPEMVAPIKTFVQMEVDMMRQAVVSE